MSKEMKKHRWSVGKPLKIVAFAPIVAPSPIRVAT